MSATNCVHPHVGQMNERKLLTIICGKRVRCKIRYVYLINYKKIIDILTYRYTCNNSRSCVIVLYSQQITYVAQSNEQNLSIIRSSKKGSYKIHTCGPVHQLKEQTIEIVVYICNNVQRIVYVKYIYNKLHSRSLIE